MSSPVSITTVPPSCSASLKAALTRAAPAESGEGLDGRST